MELPDIIIKEYLDARSKETPEEKEQRIQMVKKLREERRKMLSEEKEH